jgi:hypothetical protein
MKSGDVVVMKRLIVFAAFVVIGIVVGYSDAIAMEAEILMAIFTMSGVVVIMLMEHRKDVRFPVLMRTVFAYSDSGTGEGVTENVSMDGCKIKSTTTVESGAVLRLQLYPPAEAPKIEIQRAVVGWTKEGQFGVRFSEMGRENKEKLRHLLIL